MSALLREALHERLDGVQPPAGDVGRARRRGARRRRARQGVAAACVVALVGGLALGTLQVVGPEPDAPASGYPSLGRLDFSEGLRAYADPGRTIHLGGREFDAADLSFLDTDAVATAHGVVFYDGGRPMLLDEAGTVHGLGSGGSAPEEFHPTAKADATSGQVAWATLHDGTATITVRDLVSDEDVATLDVECGGCDDLVIEGLDSGALFYRTDDATMVWDIGDADPQRFAGPGTRVADVRAGVVLYDGPEPSTKASRAWRLVPGAIDAQLTFDGRHVLSWSSRLAPTEPGNDPVVLEEGPRKQGALGFWAIDTDGSVLVAALTGKYPHYTVFDCAVPAGTCAEVGPLTPRGGDPMFIGADM